MSLSKAFKILMYISSQKPVGVLQCYLESVATYFYRQNRTSSNKVIKYLCHKYKIQYSTDNYPALCHHFRLPSLQHRRQVADMFFLHKCVHSHLDSSYLVGNIQYHCPSRSLRNYTPFRISNSRILTLGNTQF